MVPPPPKKKLGRVTLTLTLACGPDEVPASVLKELAPSIAPWLSFIFRKSYHTGAVTHD